MENIAKELLPIAKSEMEKLKRELKIKYIADARYVMPNNNTAYYYDGDLEDLEDGEYEDFGEFTLLSINSNSIKSAYGSEYDIDWDEYIDACFALCRALNKLPEVKKYGKVTTEQPDDGDSIRFIVNKKLLSYIGKENDVEMYIPTHGILSSRTAKATYKSMDLKNFSSSKLTNKDEKAISKNKQIVQNILSETIPIVKDNISKIKQKYSLLEKIADIAPIDEIIKTYTACACPKFKYFGTFNIAFLDQSLWAEEGLGWRYSSFSKFIKVSEKAISDLCEELNKNKTITKYGKIISKNIGPGIVISYEINKSNLQIDVTNEAACNTKDPLMKTYEKYHRTIADDINSVANKEVNKIVKLINTMVQQQNSEYSIYKPSAWLFTDCLTLGEKEVCCVKFLKRKFAGTTALDKEFVALDKKFKKDIKLNFNEIIKEYNKNAELKIVKNKCRVEVARGMDLGVYLDIRFKVPDEYIEKYVNK